MTFDDFLIKFDDVLITFDEFWGLYILSAVRGEEAKRASVRAGYTRASTLNKQAAATWIIFFAVSIKVIVTVELIREDKKGKREYKQKTGLYLSYFFIV